MDTIDYSKDHYGALGVKPTATSEELKSAYVHLALVHHPDTANPDNRKSNEKFHAISEAWSVLSKPDSRKKYDAARMRFLSAQNKAGFNTSSNSSDSAAYGESLDAAVISSIYDTQRENYSRVYAAAATSTREDLVARQQYERWQNRPLHEKKAIRARRVHSLGGSLIIMAATPVILVGIATAISHVV